MSERHWMFVVSGVAFGIATYMLYSTVGGVATTGLLVLFWSKELVENARKMK